MRGEGDEKMVVYAQSKTKSKRTEVRCEGL